MNFLPIGQPEAISTEQVILGAMIQDQKAIGMGCAHLTAEDFHDPRHRALFEVLFELHAVKRQAVTGPILADSLKAMFGKELTDIGGQDYLFTIIHGGAVPRQHLETYCHKLKEKTAQRRLLDVAVEITRIVHEDGEKETPEALVSRSLERLSKVLEGRNIHRPATWQETLLQARAEVINACQGGGNLAGIKTGIADVDELIGGLRPGELVILAARPSVGKTAMAMQVAMEVARGENVLFFSLEMEGARLALRSLMGERKIELADLQPEDVANLDATMDRVADRRLWIADTPNITAELVSLQAKQLHAEQKGLGLVIVDYLTLMKPSINTEKNGRYDLAVATMSKAMKTLARELGLPVLLLSQLNRETEKAKGPQLSHLRESGAIEQDADVVLFLHRPEDETPEKVRLTVAKNRYGRTGQQDLWFKGSEQRFYPMSLSAV
ncbi:MAG: replicative DNA helicase [Candidatus Hinthialibacteria bacterium]